MVTLRKVHTSGGMSEDSLLNFSLTLNSFECLEGDLYSNLE